MGHSIISVLQHPYGLSQILDDLRNLARDHVRKSNPAEEPPNDWDRVPPRATERPLMELLIILATVTRTGQIP